MVIKIKDNHYNSYMANLKELDSKKVAVGLLKSAGQDLVNIGVANEFGVKSQNIPKRSFIRSTFNKNKRKVRSEFRKIFRSFKKSRINVKTKLKEIGLTQEKNIKKTIYTLKTPPNAPYTIEKKGFDNPLIETGKMYRSISYQIRKK